MAPDRDSLLGLARLRDELGVLSVYVTAPADERSAPQPAWEIRMRNGLRDLVERLREAGPRERLMALTARLEGLEDDLAWLADPASPGLGRALFAPLGGGEAVRVSLQAPLGDAVVLEPDAFVRPLVEAAERAAPAGVVAVSRDGVRALDLRDGGAHEVAHLSFDEATGDWREMRGPAGANPALAQQSVSQRDRFERRLDEARHRFLASAAPRVAELVDRHGWARVVLAGDPRLTGPLAEELSATARMIEDDRALASLPPAEVAEIAVPLIEADRLAAERELAERALAAAAAGERGAAGLAEVLGALAEGRVEHLLIEAGRAWSGVRAADGRLAPEGGRPPGAAEDELLPEPHLGERMIEAALASGARVTALEGEAAALLADADGVAALLRW